MRRNLNAKSQKILVYVCINDPFALASSNRSLNNNPNISLENLWLCFPKEEKPRFACSKASSKPYRLKNAEKQAQPK